MIDVSDNDYRGFLKRRVEGLEEKVAGGNFIDKNGKEIEELRITGFLKISQRDILIPNALLWSDVFISGLVPLQIKSA